MGNRQQVELASPQVFSLLLGAIGLTVLPHAWNLSWEIFWGFFALWCWRCIGVWRPQYLPSKALLFALTLLSLGFLYSQHQGVFGRDAGTRIFVVALGLKLLEIKSKRDVSLTVNFAFIIAATLFLYQQSLFMAAYIVVVCLSLLMTLCALNSKITAVFLLARSVGLMLLQALPVCIALFVLFPRLEAPRWAFLNERTLTKSGLSDTLEPGSITDLGLSDELVFRVKFTGSRPPPEQLYWRGPVFSHTDGKHWTPSSSHKARRHIDDLRFAGSSYNYTLLMEPQSKPWVFALDMPASLAPNLVMTADYQLITTVNPEQRAEYALRSYTQYTTGTLPPLEAQENLALPQAISPEIKDLVRDLQGFNQPPEVFIQAVLGYFREQPFYYSLSPPLMVEHPIDTFLFQTRTGFCSHYATAFVYLLRVAKIPARVVSGYQGGKLNAIGEFLEIRQADAHAWAEVWLAGQGWVRFDPTAAVAPERIQQGVNIDLQLASGSVNFSLFDAAAQQGMLAEWYQTLRQGWQNVDYSWQRWVINYNTANQASFLQGLGMPDMAAALRWMLITIALCTISIFGLIMRRPAHVPDLALRHYQRFCRRLARHNLVCAAGETASQFAQRVSEQLPACRTDVERITQLYLHCRYGKHVEASQLQALAKLVAGFKIKT